MATASRLSEQAQAVYDVLVATARRDAEGRLVSTEPLYRFLLDRFGIEDPASRRVRTLAVRELTAQGLVRRLTVRGPGVEVLVQDAPSPARDGGRGPVEGDNGEALGYEDYAAAIDGELDAESGSSRRVEQAFLRRVLLAGRPEAACGFCGRVLPADLLVAAHLKRRADLTREERLRFRAVAALACMLGCDSLYELGYLAIDGNGHLMTSTSGAVALECTLAGLEGKAAPAWSQDREPFLAEHRASRFRAR